MSVAGLAAGAVIANQTVVAVGANIVINTTAMFVGNSTVWAAAGLVDTILS
jgi:hypothetical protein